MTDGEDDHEAEHHERERLMYGRIDELEAREAELVAALSHNEQLDWERHEQNCSDCQRAGEHQRYLLGVLVRNSQRARALLARMEPQEAAP